MNDTKISNRTSGFRRPKLSIISSICSILLGGIIAFISTASFLIDIISTQNPIAIAIDIVVMSVSYLTVWQGVYFTIADRIAKERMEEQWEYRVQPLLGLLTETAGKVDAIEKDVATTNLKLNTAMEYMMNSKDMDASKAFILPGASFRFISKVLVLIFFTFASLVYVSSYPLGMVHYFIMVIYLTWWVFITAEYKLFGSTVAWVWAIAPILIIPTTGIILSAIYGLNIMIGMLFVALLAYVYSYYTWASYSTTGYKMIDLRPVIYQIRQRFKKDQQPVIDSNEYSGVTK